MPIQDDLHTFYLTIDDQQRWAYVIGGSLTYTDVEGSEIDKLSFSLEDKDDAITVTAWDEVILYDGEDAIFGGYVVKSQPTAAASGNRRRWDVSCESWATILARAPKISKTWVGQTVKAIAQDIFDRALDPSGTPPNQTEFDTDTLVDAGSTLTVFSADNESAIAILDRLARVAGDLAGAAWAWKIDADKNLVMGAVSGNAAPFAIVNIADADWEDSFPPVGEPQISTDESSIVNRVTVRGGTKPSDPVTDTFSGDGSTLLFGLSHQRIRQIIRITVDGSLQWHGVDWYDSYDDYECLVNYRAGTVRWNTGDAPGVGSDNVVVVYRHDETVQVTVSDAGSYATYGRYFDAYIEEPSLTSLSAATDYANSILDTYANPIVSGEVVTDRLGIQAGQQLSITYPVLGLSGSYTVRRVTHELNQAGNGMTCYVQFGGLGDSLSAAVRGAPAGLGSGGTAGGGAGSGGSGYDQASTPSLTGEVGVLRVYQRIEIIDPLTNWNSEADPDTATGWIGTYNPDDRAGKWLGYDAGTLQAYLDSDGTIKAGGGDVVLDEDGITMAMGSALAGTNRITWENDEGTVIGGVSVYESAVESTVYASFYAGGSAINDDSHAILSATGLNDAMVTIQANGGGTIPSITLNGNGITGANNIYFTGDLILSPGAIRPLSDSTTAIVFTDSAETVNLLVLDTTNDRVGIGTDNPESPTHIVYPYSRSNTTARNVLTLSSNDATNFHNLRIQAKGHASDQTQRYFSFQTGNDAVPNLGILALQPSGGKVGIGTTSPDYLLDIAGWAGADSGIYTPEIRPHADSTAAITFANAAGTSDIIIIDTTNERVGINTAPGVGYSLDVAGNVYILNTQGDASMTGFLSQLRAADSTTLYASVAVGGGVTMESGDTPAVAGGVRGFAWSKAGSSPTTIYGVWGEALDQGSATTAYGVYGKASGATTNWAGYFVGDTWVDDTLYLGVQGSDPGVVANAAAVYVKDVSSSAEVFVKDEAGNVTQISPHDPDTGEWIFYSTNTRTGRTVRVDMERLVKAVEAMTGDRFMIETQGETCLQ